MAAAYDALRRPDFRERRRGVISYAKHEFNCMVRKALFTEHSPSEAGLRVASLCGGAGQDLNHVYEAGAAEFHVFDISGESIAQAESRISEKCQKGKRKRYELDFKARELDCFASDFCDKAALAVGGDVRGRYDVVICNYALHYGWANPEMARQAVKNAAALMKPGGVFIGAMVDADVVAERRAAAVDGVWTLEHGDDWVLRFTFQERGYLFNMRDPGQRLKDGSVWQMFKGAGLKEYVVDKGELDTLAAECGLKPIGETTNSVEWMKKVQPRLVAGLNSAANIEVARTYCVFRFKS